MSKNPYPIAVSLMMSEGKPPTQGQIVKLTGTGFLVQYAAASPHKMGDYFLVSFQVPGFEVYFNNESVKVVKSYLSYAVGGDGQKNKIQMVELHFGQLDPNKKRAIDQFVQQTTSSEP